MVQYDNKAETSKSPLFAGKATPSGMPPLVERHPTANFYEGASPNKYNKDGPALMGATEHFSRQKNINKGFTEFIEDKLPINA